MRPEDQRDPRPRYTVIPRTLIFLMRDHQVLLLHGAATKRLWAGKYNGLGGHIERGESPYQAALREVQEEAGLAVEELTFRAAVHITLPEPPGVMLFVFVGEAPTGDPHPSPEGTPTWVARNALYDLPLVEDLPQLLPRVLEEEATPFFAHYYFTPEGLCITFD